MIHDPESIEGIIEKHGVYVCKSKGISMKPMLGNGCDTVFIVPNKGRLKKYDVALYRRGSDYVLHRVVKVLPDSYVIRGDNCLNKEYGITDDQIIGVLTSFIRNGKQHSCKDRNYRLYSVLRVFITPAIMFFRRAYALFRGILRKILKR